MSAAERLAALDDLPARDLLAFTEGTLRALVEIMNKETMLLRAARHHLERGASKVADLPRAALVQPYVLRPYVAVDHGRFGADASAVSEGCSPDV